MDQFRFAENKDAVYWVEDQTKSSFRVPEKPAWVKNLHGTVTVLVLIFLVAYLLTELNGSNVNNESVAYVFLLCFLLLLFVTCLLQAAPMLVYWAMKKGLNQDQKILAESQLYSLLPSLLVEAWMLYLQEELSKPIFLAETAQGSEEERQIALDRYESLRSILKSAGHKSWTRHHRYWLEQPKGESRIAAD